MPGRLAASRAARALGSAAALLGAGCSVVFEPPAASGFACTAASEALRLEALNTGSDEDDPAVSRDGTVIVFNRVVEQGGGQIYWATREEPCTEWGEAEPLREEINTPRYETNPTLSPDGQTLYFVRRLDQQRDAFRSTRPGDVWGMPVEVDVNTDANENDLFPIDGGTFYLERDKELHRGRFGGSVSPPLDLLGGDGSEREPWVSADEREIYFTGRPSQGSDPAIYRAERSTPDDPFDAATSVRLEDEAPLPQDPSLAGGILYFALGPDGERDLHATAEPR